MNRIKTKTETLIRKMRNENKISEETKRIIYPKSVAPPRLYGLPKIHKMEVPLRPIVSYINTPTYELSKLVSRLIKPL